MARARQMSIRTRILALPLLFLVGVLLLQGANYFLDRRIRDAVLFPEFEAQVLAGHQNALKALVEAEALSLGQAVKGVEDKAQRFALIEKLTDPQRFFEDKSGYFFAYDLKGTRVNVPVNKAGNGKNFLDLKDQKGNSFIAEMVQKSQAGGGFVEYYFDKPGKGVQPKLSYVKLIPGTDLFVGTGVYIDNVVEEREGLRAKLDQKNSEYNAYKLAIVLAVFALVLLMSLFITRAITRAINRVIAGLTDSSGQVATSSSHVSSTSQQLAEGSSRQAAALEESAAALEEMSSMTSTNAGHARQADGLMGQARQVVREANTAMGALTGAMQEISEASQQTSKIIKTIDEIAFQTNLLALNAAVEAARAGEAGAGFAVVAGEVRNLAMRAAEAAKNTAQLIEGTVQKIKEGSDLVDRTAQAFGQVAQSTNKVGDLVGEIASASSEQAQGIEQVSKAVAAMDQVTQQNAAHAQESAASSEQMNAQAKRLHELVGDLVALAGSRSSASTPITGRLRLPFKQA
ncbi:MAG: cache domain-containing protein [Desulfarculus sp.]|nr:cache domain-containing protein [Desulfarculus sp.]